MQFGDFSEFPFFRNEIGSLVEFRKKIGSCPIDLPNIELSPIHLAHVCIIAWKHCVPGNVFLLSAWDADVYRLSELRAKCRKAPECTDGTHSITVVRDREHLAAIREARDTAEQDFLAVCDLFGPAGETSVFIPSQEAVSSGVKVKLFYNSLARSVSPENRDEYAKRLSSAGIQLCPAPNVHAKFMTWDDDAVLVTSFNWLATTPDPWKPRGAEIGILIKGPGLVKDLQSRFAEAAQITISAELASQVINFGEPSSSPESF